MTNLDFTKQRTYLLATGYTVRPIGKQNRQAKKLHVKVTVPEMIQAYTNKKMASFSFNAVYTIGYLRRFCIGVK